MSPPHPNSEVCRQQQQHHHQAPQPHLEAGLQPQVPGPQAHTTAAASWPEPVESEGFAAAKRSFRIVIRRPGQPLVAGSHTQFEAIKRSAEQEADDAPRHKGPIGCVPPPSFVVIGGRTEKAPTDISSEDERFSDRSSSVSGTWSGCGDL